VEYLLRETCRRRMNACWIFVYCRRNGVPDDREANSALDGAYWPRTLIYQTATLLDYWSGLATAHLAPSPGPCPGSRPLQRGELFLLVLTSASALWRTAGLSSGKAELPRSSLKRRIEGAASSCNSGTRVRRRGNSDSRNNYKKCQ
jgi:hypothetical protein